MSQLNQSDHLSSFRIDARRLWDSLEEMARIGALSKGGVRRLAYSEDDQRGRALFMSWCRDEGMRVETDAIGNIFAVLEGRVADAPAIMIGSHLDSQSSGGKYDGTYGVLSGLEVVRQLNGQGVKLDRPIELVCWANEEGARFKPAMMGSSVYAGELDLKVALTTSDHAGISVEDALNADEEWLSLPDRPDRSVGCYLEIHIEQGPILEAEDFPIGIVNGVQAIHWYEVTIVGEETHAGPPPMSYRKDAMMAASELVLAIERFTLETGPQARATVGQASVSPGSQNVVPGEVRISVDLRHPEGMVADRLGETLFSVANDIAKGRGVEISIKQIWRSPAVHFDQSVLDAFRVSATNAHTAFLEMVSGAGHDAVPIARCIPTGMLFIPCEGGVSHNEAEAITIDQAATGCSVLYDAVIALSK